MTADRWTVTNAEQPPGRYIKNEIYSRFIEDGSCTENLTVGYLRSSGRGVFYVSKLRPGFTA